MVIDHSVYITKIDKNKNVTSIKLAPCNKDSLKRKSLATNDIKTDKRNQQEGLSVVFGQVGLIQEL
jgi:hypothetical protein